MKETYVLAMINGEIYPCIIRRAINPCLDVGDNIITDRGNAICVTEEVGRWDEEDCVATICNVMGYKLEELPKVTGTIVKRMWAQYEEEE